MIGVQCHWWFVEDTLEHLRVHFKFFCGWWFYGKLKFMLNFALWSSFQVEFERIINGLGGQKSSQGSVWIWSNGIQCKNWKIFYWRVTGALFWVKNIKVPFWIGHPHLHIKHSLYVCRRFQGSQIFKQNWIISIRSRVIVIFLILVSLALGGEAGGLGVSRVISYSLYEFRNVQR